MSPVPDVALPSSDLTLGPIDVIDTMAQAAEVVADLLDNVELTPVVDRAVDVAGGVAAATTTTVDATRAAVSAARRNRRVAIIGAVSVLAVVTACIVWRNRQQSPESSTSEPSAPGIATPDPFTADA